MSASCIFYAYMLLIKLRQFEKCQKPYAVRVWKISAFHVKHSHLYCIFKIRFKFMRQIMLLMLPLSSANGFCSWDLCCWYFFSFFFWETQLTVCAKNLNVKCERVELYDTLCFHFYSHSYQFSKLCVNVRELLLK